MPDGGPPRGREEGLDWIRSVMERFEGPLLRLASRFVDDEGQAQEVVQDTFVRLLEQAPDSVRSSPALTAWLYTTCRRRALDIRRGERRMREHVTVEASAVERAADHGGEPVEQLAREESQRHAARRLDELPERQREALRLKFQDGLSYREIAAATGQSVGSVGFHVHTGLKTLRGLLVRAEQRSTHG